MAKQKHNSPNNDNPKSQPQNNSAGLASIKQSIDNLRNKIEGIHHQYQTDKIEESKPKTIWGKIAKHNSIINVFATISLTFATFLLYREAVSENNLSDQRFRTEIDEFRTLNKPFLEIDSLIFEPWVIGQPINYVLKIKNLGNFPAKLLQCEIASAVKYSQPDTTSKDYTLDGAPTTILASYASKESKADISIHEGIPLDTARVVLVQRNNYYYYIWGKCHYQNLINERISTYNFMIKSKGGKKFFFIYSDNK